MRIGRLWHPSYLVQPRNPLEARNGPILRPEGKQLPALLLDGRVGQLRGAADAQALEQRLVGKGTLELRPRVLDQAVEQDQRADLAVDVAVLELLANGAGGFRGAGALQLDDIDEVGDAAKVVFFVGLRGEVLDGHGDGRVWLLLQVWGRPGLAGSKGQGCVASSGLLLEGESNEPVET